MFDAGFALDASPDGFDAGLGATDSATPKDDNKVVDGADAGPACVPSAEVCNGKDDDCDQQIDEGAAEAPIGKACGNGGQGVCAMMGAQVCFNGAVMCNAPPPAPQPETCDGIDNDCNGKVDDGAAFAAKGTACTAGKDDCKGTGVLECDPADPTTLRCTAVAKPKNACGTSCGPVPAEDCSTPGDDNCNGIANEGCCISSTEVCDGKDNDCDGMVDDVAGVGAACTAGVNECVASGVKMCGEGGVLVCNAVPKAPGVELCGDNKDNDCDGMVDEGFFVNQVQDPGFEAQSTAGISLPWRSQPKEPTLVDLGVHHEGAKSALVGTQVYQILTLSPNTAYKVQAWIRVSGGPSLMGLGGAELDDNETTLIFNGNNLSNPAYFAVVSASTEFTLLSTTFTTKNKSRVAVYVDNSDSGGASSFYLDDVSVVRMDCGP